MELQTALQVHLLLTQKVETDWIRVLEGEQTTVGVVELDSQALRPVKMAGLVLL
jgi:hypothetical protein